jgi:CRISPR-associated protein Cas1
MLNSREQNAPLIPVRMLNEHVYCPRLAYMMWVQHEWADSADTVEGRWVHRRVDKPSKPLPEPDEETPIYHARSISLGSEKLGITAKLDLVEGNGDHVMPVDYKRGKRPHVAKGAYDPERVQLCAQGLLLQEHGYACHEGMLYFAGSRERVHVAFDEELITLTLQSIKELQQNALSEKLPPPLSDSPKCSRCSLVGICLPDEMRFLNYTMEDSPRPLFARESYKRPLYAQSSQAYIRKDHDVLQIEVDKEKVAHSRLGEISQLVLFGSARLTTPALHACLRKNIPVTWLSYGGWFMGHTIGTGHHNVQNRICQYQAAFNSQTCLDFSRRLIAAKIINCRTMMRRNSKQNDIEYKALLIDLRGDSKHALRAQNIDELLGCEGSAARRYFKHFSTMLNISEATTFDFNGRNRRPPKDPINAMLSFGYALLVREWTVALSAVGLDPYLGLYHQPRFGRPALALDMMEPYRPLVVDSIVISALNQKIIQADSFETTKVGCNLKEKGRKAFIRLFEQRLEKQITHPLFKYQLSYRRLFELQSRLLIRWLTGEIEVFPHITPR